MWFLFGSTRRVRPVKNGRVLDDRCPECGETTRLVECEVQETTKLYEVVTVDDELSTAFRCTRCGELFDLVDRDDRRVHADDAPRESADERRLRELATRLAQKRQREQRRREAVKSASIDAELEALKKKLGR